MNKNITIAGILIIMGIIAYSSYNDAENNKIEEVKKQAEVKQNYLKEQEKRKAEIEKARLNAEAEKAKKDAEIEKARLNAEAEKAKKDAEIEKARLNAEAEKAKKDAEIEKARLKLEAQKASRIRQQQEAIAQSRAKQREHCANTLDSLNGKFNKATGAMWDDDDALQEIENIATRMKLQCPDNRSEFQEIVNKCINQLN